MNKYLQKLTEASLLGLYSIMQECKIVDAVFYQQWHSVSNDIITILSIKKQRTWEILLNVVNLSCFKQLHAVDRHGNHSQ